MNARNAVHNADNAPQAAEGQNLWSRVMKKVGDVTTWTRKNGAKVLAPLLIVAAPDEIHDDHHQAAGLPQHVAPHQQHEGQKHHEGAHDKKFSSVVLAKLKRNREALAEIEKIGLPEYYNQWHAKEPIAVPERSVLKLRMRCVDERQSGNEAVYEESESHGLAGVGVLADDKELEGIARDAVEIALAKSKERGDVVEIVVEPHRKCGAVKHSWSKKKDEEKSNGPNAIDDEAIKAAERTNAALNKAIKDLGAEKNVRTTEVRFFDEKKLLDTPFHPAAIINVVYARDIVAKTSLKNGPLAYNVSGNIGNKAIYDATLAATLAKKEGHGMHAGPEGLPMNTRVHIAPWVDSDDEGKRRKADIEEGLRTHKDLGEYFRNGMIIVEPWTVPKNQPKNVEPKNVKPKNERPQEQSWLNPLKHKINPVESLNRHERRKSQKLFGGMAA